jgi:ribosomal protein S18 acetylase RimI-like enzyme
MEYQTLEKTGTFCLYQTFRKAFSDYQAPVDMPYEAFETNLKRNGYMPGVSVGAFVNGELTGIVLNGVRYWDGEKTIYDLGTGVIPALRKRGITKKMLSMVQTICRDHGISRYQLEVIQENTAAVSLYKKQGFQVMRGLNCYMAERNERKSHESRQWQIFLSRALTPEQWECVRSFWDDSPSWQNSIDSVCAIADSFACILAEISGKLIGYGIINKANGDIVQLAVKPEYRRLGVATDIMRYLQEQTGSPKIKMINIEQQDEALNMFLKQSGFSVFLKQYEMEKKL